MDKKHFGIRLPGTDHAAIGQHMLPTAVTYLLLAFVCLFQKEEEKFEAWQALHNAFHSGIGFGPALSIDVATIESICQTTLSAVTGWAPEAGTVYCLASTMNRPSMRRPISVYS